MSIRGVARTTGCSHVSVLKWIKNTATEVETEIQPTDLKEVELDEMHHYIKKK